MSAWSDWFRKLNDPALDETIGRLYAELDTQIAAKQPVCDQSGRCCRFDAFGHLLYVTGLEIARFLKHAHPTPTRENASIADPTNPLPLPQLNNALPPACSYQVDGLCSVHTIRPLGCRIFFCQPGTDAWQQDLYEHYLQQLRQLHEQWSLPYRYMEWRAGLREAEQAIAANSRPG